jgi:hypothetical protein
MCDVPVFQVAHAQKFRKNWSRLTEEGEMRSEVKLQPGWLARDMERAAQRVREWQASSAKTASTPSEVKSTPTDKAKPVLRAVPTVEPK